MAPHEFMRIRLNHFLGMIAFALILPLVIVSFSWASDGPFFYNLILKRNKYVTYKTHYPDEIYLSYEGDVDIPFKCYYTYNNMAQIIVEIMRPSVKGFRRVDIVLYMGVDRKLVGMDRDISRLRTFIINRPDTRPPRPFEKAFQEPENLNIRIKMYPELEGKILRQMDYRDIIKDDKIDRIPCLIKVWWKCG
jgi:hypothetical protein